MAQIDPGMRLKVKGDTFFVAGSDGSAYLRNNEGSFRMEGDSIAMWLDQLIPAFDGTSSLAELTAGLPDAHRERVFEVAAVLLQHGYVRDVSQDLPHQLPDEVLKKHASKVEFLDMLGGSGGTRLQAYRQAKVLAVGAGPFFASLVASLLESGLPKIHGLITDAVQTNRERVAELVAHAKRSDAEVEWQEVQPAEWREVVQAFDWVLYVAQDADVEELLALQTACLAEKKALFPAVCLCQVGLAGPLVHPEGTGSWDSVWHRLHQAQVERDPQLHAFSSTAGALLANVAVYELFKTITGVSPLQNTFFLLNLETLEGNWHWFLPHPRVTGLAEAACVEKFEQLLRPGAGRTEIHRFFSYFHWLTSAEAGIFHRWEEEDLIQLPMAQCRVQAVDPLSAGPAALLPDVVCSSLTHHEARLQAGFAGIEAYVTRLIEGQAEGVVGVGTGASAAEGIGRGLQKCLAHEWLTRENGVCPAIRSVQLDAVEDPFCSFCLHALTSIQGAPSIGLGQDVCGFPVAWVGTGGRWYGSAGLNVTLALGAALQQALAQAQNGGLATFLSPFVLERASVTLNSEDPQRLRIPAGDQSDPSEIVQAALRILKGQGKRLTVRDLAVEPFLREVLAGVFGVVLEEEGSR